MSCKAYDDWVARLEEQEPSVADFARLEEHEQACSCGHSEAAVEKTLGLSPGSLRCGDLALGLQAPQALIGRLVDSNTLTAAKETGRPTLADRQEALAHSEFPGEHVVFSGMEVVCHSPHLEEILEPYDLAFSPDGGCYPVIVEPGGAAAGAGIMRGRSLARSPLAEGSDLDPRP